MASVIISGDTSGSVTLLAPATAGSNTIVLPSGSGTLTLPTGTATLTANGLNSNIVSGTAIATTSGTVATFTGIPSWVKRITLNISGLSSSGTNQFIVQIGSGSLTTSGYVSASIVTGGSTTSTSGFSIFNNTASNAISGSFILNNLSGNIWVFTGLAVYDGASFIVNSSGKVTLSGVLDRFALLTTSTDTFDAGSINILYE
jgi:hypothetical protein